MVKLLVLCISKAKQEHIGACRECELEIGMPLS